MSEQQEYWFAARTRKDQEFAIRNSLEKLNVECFMPTQFVIRQLKYRKRRVEVPVIRNLIFVRTTKDRAWSITKDYNVQLFYMKDLRTNSLLIIPDKQMRDFMFLLDFSDSTVEVINEELKRGDRVRVIKGPLIGLEGELLRIKGHKRVIVRLEGVVSVATSYIPGSFLEKIK